MTEEGYISMCQKILLNNQWYRKISMVAVLDFQKQFFFELLTDHLGMGSSSRRLKIF